MERAELRRFIGVTGYSLAQVEKDYFQHLVLAGLSQRTVGKLVFKGGTALQKTGVVTRFSEDLDFSAIDEIPLNSLQNIVIGTLNENGYTAELDKKKEASRSMTFRAKIKGPLFRGPSSICTIRVDVSKREDILLPPKVVELVPPYSEVRSYDASIMDLQEIVSEKVCAVLSRTRAKDLYDLYMLVQKGTSLRSDVLHGKLMIHGMTFTKGHFIERCEMVSKRWEGELFSLMEVVPDREEVMRCIEDTFSSFQEQT